MKKLVSLLLSIIILLSETAVLGLSVHAADLQSIGSCGDNVTYTFDYDTGLLTISGNGEMNSWTNDSSSPSYYTNNPFFRQFVIKEVIINNGVTSIGNYAFFGCTGLLSITIPDSVKSIGFHAFYDCSSLKNVIIPDSVQEIGGVAFFGCKDLINIEISNNVTCIDKYTFCECTNLESVRLPKRLDSIREYAFFNCLKLTKICIPDNIEIVESNAFNTLNEITIPEVAKIDFCGFDNCSDLTKINISYSNGIMADWAMDYKDSLWYKHRKTVKEINLEDGIISISESAFYDCSNLIKTNIPESVKHVGRYAYYGCSNLKNLTVNSYDCSIPDSEYTIDKLATIYAYNMSTAQKYAEKYNRSFESLGKYVCSKHIIIEDKAIPATCGATGLTSGAHCATCGTILVERETIPATEKHTYDSGKITKTTSTTYTKTFTCKVCGKKYTNSYDKAANTLTVKAKKPTVKYSSLKKKNQTISLKNAMTISKAQGKVTYSKSSGNSKITVSSAGKITVKKGLKKGTYKVKIKLTAAGNNTYKKGNKTVSVTIVVK